MVYSFLMQEVELWEASCYGLVNRIPDLLKCVNVNVGMLVSNTNTVRTGAHNDVRSGRKSRSVQRPRKRLNLENVLTIVPLL